MPNEVTTLTKGTQLTGHKELGTLLCLMPEEHPPDPSCLLAGRAASD